MELLLKLSTVIMVNLVFYKQNQKKEGNNFTVIKNIIFTLN